MTANPLALEVLQGFSGTKLELLYRQPSTALAVFRRMLPHLAKTIVMAMLYMPNPFLASDLDAWIRPDAVAEKEQALLVLSSLHVMKTAMQAQGPRAYILGKVFAKSLRQALTGSGEHKSFGVPCRPAGDEVVDIKILDEHARRQWEDILYYMVGSTTVGVEGKSHISDATKSLLELGNFVDKRGRITQTGFTFLLQEVNAQVWSLLIVYLNHAPELLKMDPVEILSFIFMLGSLELGQGYSTANLSSTQKQMLDDLADFGIIYRPSPSTPFFYPTRLATTLTSDASALHSSAAAPTPTFDTGLAGGSGAASKGYIIVETNYRLYAYTESMLQISVLALFTRLTMLFPNMVTGRLTKTSVQRAIAQGITADQIISYLAAHAHPQMLKSTPVLPPTVVDQIRLWQIEGDRMTTTSGYMMIEFATEAEYRDTVEYAETVGLLVWKSDAKRCFFVNRIEQIKSYMANRRGRA
ncbi:RNA polymerase II transcription factor B 52 kDa subunit [Coniosporium apollinis]|uniref:RNA polymerase II transcription factor B subunit 2 n=1 Tax=Coniosporium apollinis TaxID=61459 RepID=A0ABQ9P455_9PEZI|nr:RNA polymerase II transcription factor B 52 kDa subunit [Coniosporium apollinis]